MDVWGIYAAGFATPESARYKQTAAPSGEPVTAAELRDQLNLFGTSYDTYLGTLIARARQIVEQRWSRQLLTATWTLSLDAFPDEIQLEVVPVASVTSIVYTDYAGATQTLPSNQYQVDLSSPRRPARIRPVWGLVWPITRVGTYNAVVVTFTAGDTLAASVPPCAKAAVLYLAAAMFRYRESVSDQQVFDVFRVLDDILAAEDPGIYV